MPQTFLMLALYAAFPMWVALLLTLVVFYEVRRAKRIKRNLPVDDTDPSIELPGFEVEPKKTDQRAGSASGAGEPPG